MGQKGSKSGLFNASILDDDEGTVVLNSKEKVYLSDRTVLTLENVCRLYEQRFHFSNKGAGPSSPSPLVSPDEPEEGGESDKVPEEVISMPVIRETSSKTKLLRRRKDKGGSSSGSSTTQLPSNATMKRRGSVVGGKTDEAKCLQMIETIFALLLRNQKTRRQLLHISFEPFAKLLSSDNLLAPSEFTLFLLVGAWADNQIEEKMLQSKLKETEVEGQRASLDMPSSDSNSKENIEREETNGT